jgi:hypothetical protein
MTTYECHVGLVHDPPEELRHVRWSRVRHTVPGSDALERHGVDGRLAWIGTWVTDSRTACVASVEDVIPYLTPTARCEVEALDLGDPTEMSFDRLARVPTHPYEAHVRYSRVPDLGSVPFTEITIFDSKIIVTCTGVTVDELDAKIECVMSEVSTDFPVVRERIVGTWKLA